MRKWKIILLMFLAILSIGALSSCGTKETTTKELTFADVLKKVEVGRGEPTTVDKQEFLSTRSITLPSNETNNITASNTALQLYFNKTVKVNKVEFDVTFGNCYHESHKDSFDMGILYGIWVIGLNSDSSLNTINEVYETGKEYHFIIDFTEIRACETKEDILIHFNFDRSNMFCHHEAYITNFDIDFIIVE